VGGVILEANMTCDTYDLVCLMVLGFLLGAGAAIFGQIYWPPLPWKDAADKLAQIKALAVPLADKQCDEELTPLDVADELSDVVHSIAIIVR
jgi:hypothetical protein